ncbi:hypothetical protein R50073_20270 [Maricurvus nonylphenolicus]
MMSLSLFSHAEVDVYYPEVRAPYQQIFEQIIEGVTSELPHKPSLHGLSKNTKPPQPDTQQGIIIALGQRGLKAAAQGPQQVIVGAISRPPNSFPKPLYGFALTPAPAKILGKLKELAPNVTKVYAVYNPIRSQWLVDDINKACEDLNLQITLDSADNLPKAAKLINQHLDTAAPNQSAIWLLESRFSNDNSLMNQILEEAWEKNLAVFSANPSHIRRGLLFSMYPDNVKLGQALGQLAQKLKKQGLGNKEAGHDESTLSSPIQVFPLEHLHTGINVRTAEHLGLKIPRNQKFDLVYPAE